jgi:hypothetical protein
VKSLRNRDCEATVVTVLMGLGHLRAAFNLRDLAPDNELIIYGSRQATPRREYRIWKKMRKLYYFSSRAGKIPLIGKYILNFMLWLQKIKPMYPFRDHSRPNFATRYLYFLITRRKLCSGLIKRAAKSRLPLVHTFYATAIACDHSLKERIRNYLLICDADFNRVWVARKPREAATVYFAPCTQVRKRLLSYGVPEEKIHITGFPLPKENIGSPEKMEILKKDLFERLLRLDPAGKFFNYHQHSVFPILERRELPRERERYFYLNLSLGGAGAQLDILKRIVASLRERVQRDEIRLIISCGVFPAIYRELRLFLGEQGLGELPPERVALLHHSNSLYYFELFNYSLHRTDLLWTKPSELTFYCGLGIPILLSKPIGTHEEINKRWLSEIHAAIEPPASERYIDEWLFDLRLNGRLAEAAWDGFLKAPKLGTYNIEKIVREELCGNVKASPAS